MTQADVTGCFKELLSIYLFSLQNINLPDFVQNLLVPKWKACPYVGIHIADLL